MVMSRNSVSPRYITLGIFPSVLLISPAVGSRAGVLDAFLSAIF